MAGRLENRRAIVLGGARGIGEGVVEAFIAEGAKVVIADVLGGEATALCLRHANQAYFCKTDITRKADVESLVKFALSKLGGVEILCQVAGIYPDHRIEDIPEVEWDRVMAVNVKGAFLAVQACFPLMKKQNYGRIIFTGSITGPHVVWPGHAHYAASKSALTGLARAAALEGAAHGITVNVVEPGNVETPNLRRERGAQHMANMAAAVPMGRLATPREIGDIAAFYASDAAAYITGTSLVADGGQLLPEAKL